MGFGRYLKESKSFIIYGLLAAIVGMILTFFVGGCGNSGDNADVLASKRVRIDIKEAPAPPSVEPPAAPKAEAPAVVTAPAPVKKRRTTVAKKRKRPETRAKSTPEARPWAINVASFLYRPDAVKLMERLKTSGYNSYTTVFKKGSTTYYRVRVGFFASRGEAAKTGDGIRAKYRDVGKPWVVKPERTEVAKFIR